MNDNDIETKMTANCSRINTNLILRSNLYPCTNTGCKIYKLARILDEYCNLICRKIHLSHIQHLNARDKIANKTHTIKWQLLANGIVTQNENDTQFMWLI